MKIMAKLRVKEKFIVDPDTTGVDVSDNLPTYERNESLATEHTDQMYLKATKFLKQNGVWRRNLLMEWSLISVPVILFIASGIVLHCLNMPLLATILLSCGHTLAGWKSHDICHEPWRRDSWLRIAYSGIVGALSPNWWSKKHNAYHHCYPNMIDVDEDFETSPILMHKTSNNWLHKFQHIYHWIPFSFLKLSWRFQSLPAASISELTCFLIHYCIGLYVFGPKIFLLSILIDGEIAAAITTLNHDAEIKTLTPGDFMQATLRTTIDIDVPKCIAWLFGNMQYQTLHHLFPYIPSYRYESLAPVIKQFCKENGLEYRTVPLWDAYKNHKKYYYDVVREPFIGSVLEELCLEKLSTKKTL